MDSKKARSEAAAILGRKGGQVRKAKLAKLTPEERSEIGRKIANARWHPEEKEQRPAD